MLTGSSPKGCSASRQTLARQPMYRLPPHYPFIPVWETDKWFLYTSSLVQCSSWLCSWSTTTQMLSGITLPLRKNLVLFLLMKKWVVLFFHISQGPCGSPVLLFSLFLGTSCPSVFYHVTWHFLPLCSVSQHFLPICWCFIEPIPPMCCWFCLYLACGLLIAHSFLIAGHITGIVFNICGVCLCLFSRILSSFTALTPYCWCLISLCKQLIFIEWEKFMHPSACYKSWRCVVIWGLVEEPTVCISFR